MKINLVLALALTALVGTTGCTVTFGGPIAMDEDSRHRDNDPFYPGEWNRVEEPYPNPSDELLKIRFGHDGNLTGPEVPVEDNPLNTPDIPTPFPIAIR